MEFKEKKIKFLTVKERLGFAVVVIFKQIRVDIKVFWCLVSF